MVARLLLDLTNVNGWFVKRRANKIAHKSTYSHGSPYLFEVLPNCIATYINSEII